MTDLQRNPDITSQLAIMPKNSAVIFREYAHPDRAALAKTTLYRARQHGHRMLIAADWKLAIRLGADGVHSPRWYHLPKNILMPKGWLCTASAHNPKELYTSDQHPAIQAIILSPVFHTQSHPEKRPLGPGRYAALASQSHKAVYTLGGIDARNVRYIKGRSAGIAATQHRL